MLAAVSDGTTSHPYCGLVDKLGQIETISNGSALTRLAAAFRRRAVDQEYVSDQDILSLADQVLECPDAEEDIADVVRT